MLFIRIVHFLIHGSSSFCWFDSIIYVHLTQIVKIIMTPVATGPSEKVGPVG